MVAGCPLLAQSIGIPVLKHGEGPEELRKERTGICNGVQGDFLKNNFFIDSLGISHRAPQFHSPSCSPCPPLIPALPRHIRKQFKVSNQANKIKNNTPPKKNKKPTTKTKQNPQQQKISLLLLLSCSSSTSSFVLVILGASCAV